MKKLTISFALIWLLLSRALAVPLVLVNKSWRPIRLEIPGVMNPTLSPFSSSTCGLEPGQIILFKYKGKQEVLIEIVEGDAGRKLHVAALMRKRKKEIKQSGTLSD